MSRCYPCPPFGSQRNSGALKEVAPTSVPIKIQRGKETSVLKFRKDKKENKDSTKVKKTNEDTQYVGDEDQQAEKCFFPEGNVEEAEKSDITEEHEEPISQSSCYLVDSTQGSSKRENDAPVLAVGGKIWNIIRIRLPVQRQRELEASVSERRLCSKSGREDFDLQAPDECLSGFAGKKVSKVVPEPASGQDKASSSSGLKRKQLAALVDRDPTDDSLCKVLIEDWVPLPPQIRQDDSDDEEWLFGLKTEGKHRQKRCKAELDVFCEDSSYLWPCAKHLQEADIHALPFTVPF